MTSWILRHALAPRAQFENAPARPRLRRRRQRQGLKSIRSRKLPSQRVYSCSDGTASTAARCIKLLSYSVIEHHKPQSLGILWSARGQLQAFSPPSTAYFRRFSSLLARTIAAIFGTDGDCSRSHSRRSRQQARRRDADDAGGRDCRTPSHRFACQLARAHHRTRERGRASARRSTTSVVGSVTGTIDQRVVNADIARSRVGSKRRSESRQFDDRVHAVLERESLSRFVSEGVGRRFERLHGERDRDAVRCEYLLWPRIGLGQRHPWENDADGPAEFAPYPAGSVAPSQPRRAEYGYSGPRPGGPHRVAGRCRSPTWSGRPAPTATATHLVP